MTNTNEEHPLLTPKEVAELFRVTPKTVTRWARAGTLPHIKTVGGHRRYRRDAIERLLAVLNIDN